MTDYKSLPAWKQAMSVAHTIYAVVDEAGLKTTESGQRIRKAAVSVPSLIAEAFLDLSGRDREDVLFQAESKLSEVARLLSDESLQTALPADRDGLIREIAALEESIRGIKAAHAH